MNQATPDTQQDLLRFLELMDTRITELCKERDTMAKGVATLEARLYALEKQRGMALDIKKEREKKGDKQSFIQLEGKEDSDCWIHVNECSNYPQLPQPSTIRQWIRQGKLIENSHFKRLGVRKKIYLNVNKLLKDLER